MKKVIAIMAVSASLVLLASCKKEECDPKPQDKPVDNTPYINFEHTQYSDTMFLSITKSTYVSYCKQGKPSQYGNGGITQLADDTLVYFDGDTLNGEFFIQSQRVKFKNGIGSTKYTVNRIDNYGIHLDLATIKIQ